MRFHINSPYLPPIDPVAATWNPTVSEWYHVAVTSSNNSYSLFINGKSVASGTHDNEIPDPDCALAIGRAEGYFLNGLMDDIRIYNRALSDNEITDLFGGSHSVGHPDYCGCGSCAEGEGDCDSECQSGLTCTQVPGTDTCQ